MVSKVRWIWRTKMPITRTPTARSTATPSSTASGKPLGGHHGHQVEPVLHRHDADDLAQRLLADQHGEQADQQHRQGGRQGVAGEETVQRAERVHGVVGDQHQPHGHQKGLALGEDRLHLPLVPHLAQREQQDARHHQHLHD